MTKTLKLKLEISEESVARQQDRKWKVANKPFGWHNISIVESGATGQLNTLSSASVEFGLASKSESLFGFLSLLSFHVGASKTHTRKLFWLWLALQRSRLEGRNEPIKQMMDHSADTKQAFQRATKEKFPLTLSLSLASAWAFSLAPTGRILSRLGCVTVTSSVRVGLKQNKHSPNASCVGSNFRTRFWARFGLAGFLVFSFLQPKASESFV